MTPEQLKKFPALNFPGTTGNLAAIGFGNPESSPVLALHGWLDNAASFAPMASLMNDYYIVALDFAGHGLSDPRPEGAAYHMADYVADVAHVVRALEWGRFRLLGHSLGAGVALVYAAIFAEQVTALSMIDGVGPMTGEANSAPDRMRRAVDKSLAYAARDKTAERLYPDWETLVVARERASPINRASAELLLTRGTRFAKPGFSVNSDPRLKHPSAVYLSEDVVRAFIGEVKCQSQLVLAEQSMIANRSYIEARIAGFKSLQVDRLAGNHHLHMDDPEPVASAIRGFYNSVND